MKKAIVQVRNLKKTYKLYDKNIDRLKEAFSLRKKAYSKKYDVINNISFDVYRGEILGIVGRNGAGKSTLLKMVTGVLSPSEGSVKVDGKIAALLELGAGFNPEYTGIENIYLNGIMMGYSKEEIKDRIDEIIEFADIGEFIYQPVKVYSSGMFARLAFAVAVSVQPEVLIADEILSVGDVKFQDKCINKMKEMVKSGTTILFVSHDLHAIKYFCDRVIWLKDGQIQEDSSDVIGVIDKYEMDLGKNSLTGEESIFSTHNSMIKIYKTKFIDYDNTEKRRFKVGEKFKVQIYYEVFEEVKDVFMGVGMKNSKNVYVNGLNTKLDTIKVNTSIGKHMLELEYTDINLYKDIYTVWSVCYNSSGTVVLSDYIMKDILEIYNPVEIGEGVVIIPHQWRQYEEI